MTFTPEQTADLSAPLNKAVVATRTQAGRELSYIEGWHAIAEANRIFGFGEWDRETVELRQLGEPRMVGDKARVGYSCRVRITVRAGDRTIVREGCGFGSGIDKDVDQAHESALKEAETDAMKRALMTFGNPFGLALYDKTQANVEAAPSAADFAIKGLKAATSADDFKATWEANRANWKAVMSDVDYARVVTIMQSEARRWKDAA
jgi:DNA repair and recombination protein RAD52